MRTLRAAAVLAACGLCAPAPAQLPPAASEAVDFERQIQPLFAQRCYACHGADNQMNGLRLDAPAAALKGGHSGPAILPGDSAGSRLIQMVVGHLTKTRMPPVGEPLTDEQIGLLRAWIDQGADRPEQRVREETPAARQGHWSFQPIVRPDVPPGVNAIDYFIGKRLAAEGLEPAPPAGRAALIRRLSLDLTGLPPTLDEQLAFLNDERPGAYERLVERLARIAALRREAGIALARPGALRGTRTAMRKTTSARTPGATGAGSSTPSTAICPSTASRPSRSPATCCRTPPSSSAWRPASTATRSRTAKAASTPAEYLFEETV